MHRPSGFRAALTFVFGIVFLALVATLSVTLMHEMGDRLAREHRNVLETVAKGTSTMLAEGLFERMREVDLMASLPRSDADGWRHAIERMRATRPQFAWIGVTDAQGVVRVASSGMLEGQDVSGRPWFKGGLAGPHVGDVHPAKLLANLLPRAADGGPMRFVDFAAPVRDPAGRVIGVLGVHGAWDWAGEVIATVRGPANRERGVRVFILDAQGQVIHRPPGPEGEGKVPAEAIDASNGDRILHWEDGIDYVSVAARVTGRTATTSLGWTVVVRQPAHIALETAHQAGRVILAVGLLVGIVGLLCVWWVAGRLSDPLVALGIAARRIGEGDLATGIPTIGRSRELLELSTALQAMVSTLVSQKAEVQRANCGLEQRVRERTHELERASAELARLARRDALTGLANRRVADEQLEQEVALHRRHGHALGVMLIDVDRFKQINDQHGHGVGDRVLVELAGRLEAACRVTDCVCRFGGEEFLVLMKHTAREGAAVAAEKIRALVAARPFDGVGAVSVSIGVANLREGQSIAELLHAADAALYAAKRAGRNRVMLAAAHPPAAPATPVSVPSFAAAIAD